MASAAAAARRRGRLGARRALEVASEHTRILSTVQIGITLIAILAGAFGGSTIAEQLAGRLAAYPSLAEHADAIALGLVVLAITHLSLVVGDLVPKRVGLSTPERIGGNRPTERTRARGSATGGVRLPDRKPSRGMLIPCATLSRCA